MAKTIKLYNGNEIPSIGLGTYKSDNMKTVIMDAIDVGYRHFDCAWYYGNEEQIGDAFQEKFKEGKVKREDLFITTKLWNNYHAKDKVKSMLEDSLKRLKLSYVDLFLIHWPFGFKETASLSPKDEGPSAYSDVDYLETWQGMEECVELGLTKNIGLSNFNSEQINRILDNCKIRPAVLQIEVNPNITQKKLIRFCTERNIVVVGYCPLGRGIQPDVAQSLLEDVKIRTIGEKYSKSPAQVILNYLVSQGIAVIPKSSNKNRMIENLNIFDFKLNDDDLRYLDSCDNGHRICHYNFYKDHKYYPFNIDY